MKMKWGFKKVREVSYAVVIITAMVITLLTPVQTVSAAVKSDTKKLIIEKVTISDKSPSVGDVLTAIITPEDVLTSYIWKADGVQVATGKTYEVTETVIGKKLTVMAIGQGSSAGTVISAETDAVADLTGVGMIGTVALGTDSLGRNYAAMYPDFDYTEVEVTVAFDAETYTINPDKSGKFMINAATGNAITVTARHDLFFTKTMTVDAGAMANPLVFDKLRVEINGRPGIYLEPGATDYGMDEFGNITHSGNDNTHSYIDGVMTEVFVIQARMGFREGITDTDPKIGFVLTNGSLEMGIYLVNRPGGIGVLLQAKGPRQDQDDAKYYHDTIISGNLYSSRTYVTFTVVKEMSTIHYFIDDVYGGKITSNLFANKETLRNINSMMKTTGVALSAMDNTGGGLNNRAEFGDLLFSSRQTVINSLINSYR